MADTVERALDATEAGPFVQERPDLDVPAPPAPGPVFTARTPSGAPALVPPVPPARRDAPAVVPARERLRRLTGSRGLRVAAAVAAVAAVATTVALGATDEPAPVRTPSAGVVQEVPPPLPPGPRVRTGMLAASTWTGTSTYQLFTSGPVAAATVTLVRSGDRTRVDVVTGSGPGVATATLLSADAGWVACSTAGTSECLLVSAPGAPLPAAFDPGVGALLTSALPAMAGLDSGVTTTRTLDPGQAVGPAQCAAVTAGPVPGEYCLTDSGVLRRAVFAGGKLNLTATTGAVDPAAFTPPAPPVPLA